MAEKTRTIKKTETRIKRPARSALSYLKQVQRKYVREYLQVWSALERFNLHQPELHVMHAVEVVLCERFRKEFRFGDVGTIIGHWEEVEIDAAFRKLGIGETGSRIITDKAVSEARKIRSARTKK